MARSSTSFQPGQSGNPGGRPKVVAEVQELPREHTVEAIETLVGIMLDPKAHVGARVAASNAILDRGYGKAPASVKIENKEDSAAQQFINILKGQDRAKAVVANGSHPSTQSRPGRVAAGLGIALSNA